MTEQFRVCRGRASGIIEAIGLHAAGSLAGPYKDLKQKNFSLLSGFPAETPEKTREVGCP